MGTHGEIPRTGTTAIKRPNAEETSTSDYIKNAADLIEQTVLNHRDRELEAAV